MYDVPVAFVTQKLSTHMFDAYMNEANMLDAFLQIINAECVLSADFRGLLYLLAVTKKATSRSVTPKGSKIRRL